AGQPRNPVLLGREHWPEVMALATGDAGARTFLRARPELVTLVECGDTGRPDDIDTRADLDRVAGLLGTPAVSDGGVTSHGVPNHGVPNHGVTNHGVTSSGAGFPSDG
ncbi:MAG: hypothetical protein ACRDPO_27135, partial [Streptosporangiaceae bacterium]